MLKRKLVALGCALSMCAAVGCDEDTGGGGGNVSNNGGGGGGGDGAGTGAGGGGTGEGVAPMEMPPTADGWGGPSLEDMVPLSEWGAYNPDCPVHPPFDDVKGGQRGQCCYRSSPNSKRVPIQVQNGATLVETEYRLNHQEPVNHPYSTGLMALIGLSNDRNDYHQWNMLWRFERPYMNGAPVAGRGFVSIGWGGYNCDGTHSYYGPNAAPTDVTAFPGGDMPDRWERTRVVVDYDPAAGPEGITVPFDERSFDNTYTPFLNAGTFALEWELIANGFEIETMDFSDAGLDCTGSYSSANRWQAGHYFRSYAVVEDNHYVENGIPTLMFQTLSQLLAFGLIGNPDDLPTLNPRDGGYARCQITPEDLEKPAGMRTCRWVKLPSALCPRTDEERANWSCHIGAADNTDGNNGEALPPNCSMTAPTGPLGDNPPNEGQCCDPMGDPASNLPACNAWPIRSEYVAAAAEITHNVLAGVDKKCPGAM